MIQVDSELEWDAFAGEHDAHPLQLWGWGQVKESHGWTVARYIAQDESWGAQVLIKSLPWPAKSFAYVPRGPVGEWNSNDLQQLSDQVRLSSGSIAVSIEPNSEDAVLAKGWVKARNTILVPQTLAIDLAKSEDELLLDMSKKTRQYIRKSLSSIHVKKIEDVEGIRASLGVYRETARRANFSLHDDEYYHDIAKYLGKNSVIYGAYEGNDLTAFLWLATSKTTAFELYGGVTERGQELKANYGLKWHAITDQKSQDVSSYDLNGLLNDGIRSFKKGFASHETTLIGTYDKPLSVWYTVWTHGLPLAKTIVRKIRRH